MVWGLKREKHASLKKIEKLKWPWLDLIPACQRAGVKETEEIAPEIAEPLLLASLFTSCTPEQKPLTSMQMGQPDARFPCPLLGKVGIHDDPFSRVGEEEQSRPPGVEKESREIFPFIPFPSLSNTLITKIIKLRNLPTWAGHNRRAFVKTTG